MAVAVPPSGRDASSPVPLTPSGGAARWSPRSPVFVGLSAVVLAGPLAVLGNAVGPYDDLKAWALPVLVAATLSAWLARAPEHRERLGARAAARTRGLDWLVAAYLLWWLITTATSIAPGQSVLGNFGRGMGLLVVGSAVLLIVLVRAECQEPAAIRWLIDIALVGSVPVCLLALGQTAGWDPLPRSWDPAVANLTVRSTFGQHIFLGSYLAILVPLAAARLEAAVRRWRDGEPGPEEGPFSFGALLPGALWVAGAVGLVGLGARWVAAGWVLVLWGLAGAIIMSIAGGGRHGRRRPAVPAVLLGILVAAQIFVLVLSRARGPQLGLLFGLSVAVLTLFARRRAFWPLGVSVAGVGVLFLALVLVNVPNSPLAPLAKASAFSRLSKLTDVRGGTPGWFRLKVWGGILSGWRRQLRGEEVIPGTRPWARAMLGYGLETQLLTINTMVLPSMGVLPAVGRGWRAQYLVDRAHNTLLDHLVTGGLIGGGLWVTLVGALVAVGVSRVRAAGRGEELSLRLGCIGAVLAHLAEGQVGIATTVPLALFWMTAGLLVSRPWSVASEVCPTSFRTVRPRASWRRAAMIAVALAALLIAWINTRWLLASVAYADGARRQIEGRTAEAQADFRRAGELAPWLPLPAEALAYTSLQLAGMETSGARRMDLLREGEAALAESRRYALGGGASWTLTAQLAFAEARAGEPRKLLLSLQAFEVAARFRPLDHQTAAQWGWALLESGDARGARQMVERALALPAGRREWLPWAVLARSARELGDVAEARRAADNARRLAPPEAQRLLEGFLS